MFRLHAGVCVLMLALVALTADQPKPDDKPITTAKGELGDLLRQWHKDGTAAGNVGDWYDNRDGAHSDLNTTPYPQLSRVVYSPEDIKLRRHWAAQTITRPEVTFGNSSTSAPPQQGGSNPRHYYVSRRGLELLYQHYTHNNVYIYPEHRDHDPGRNGRNDGYGDLYPTNTPYLLISQGSSGSDQPFMRAIPFTLAAFRPEVKKKLIETGLLMPTLQMIFRSTNQHLTEPKEYLTGKAHPTVFEGAWVNDVKMVKLAHEITLKDIPPMVQLKVVEEDEPVNGRDFFEPTGVTEKLADTPAVIARIFRGKERTRRLVVSAEGSYDVNKRPLTFEWVVLRGDAEKITIKPRNAERSVAEIVIPYHERRPVAPGSTLESNRVDIGVFVHNGAYHSAPGFVTYFMLDSEARTYDGANVLEIGRDMGEATVSVSDWNAFFKAAGSAEGAGQLLPLSNEERADLRAAVEEHQKLQDALKQAQEVRKKAEGKEQVQAAQRAVDEATKAVNDFLDRPRAGGQPSLRGLADRALQQVLKDIHFGNDRANALAGLLRSADGKVKASVEAARRRLVALGIIPEGDGRRLVFQPVRAEGDALANRLSAYERAMIERFNAALLSGLLLPGAVSSGWQGNFVDPRLTTPKSWRDVYRYRGDHCQGWTRYDVERVTEFNADGLMGLDWDGQRRCLRARTVRYEWDSPTKPGDWKPLRQVPGDEIVTYEYDGEQDFKGRVKSREKAEK